MDATMDTVDQPVATASKSKLARKFAKVLNIHGNQRSKSHEKVKNDAITSDFLKFNTRDEEEEEKLREKIAMEAFIAKLFARISAVKAAYAELQFAQSPYDPDGIHAADQMVVSELKILSELKQCYLKKQIDDSSPEHSLLLAEIQEQNCILKTYEIMGKKLDYQLRLKDSEITFLREKLQEANKENKALEKRLNSSGQLSVPENLHFSGLNPFHFITVLRQTTKSIRSFVKLLSGEMESSGWDLDAAACAIVPRVSFWQANHRCYAFESFICREMFDGFNSPNFSTSRESLPEGKNRQRLFFDRFMELKPAKPTDYLAWKPKSTFARFCCKKYSRLIHPKMEQSLFGNLNQRNMVKSGEYPETNFFSAFAEMAKRVWLLHCLGFSFNAEASIFQVGKGSRFSDVYMESVCDEAFLSSESEPRVAFTVVPGFKIGKTVIQAQVYLH